MTSGYDCSPRRTLESMARKSTVKARCRLSTFAFVICVSGECRTWSGVRPHAVQLPLSAATAVAARTPRQTAARPSSANETRLLIPLLDENLGSLVGSCLESNTEFWAPPNEQKGERDERQQGEPRRERGRAPFLPPARRRAAAECCADGARGRCRRGHPTAGGRCEACQTCGCRRVGPV